MSYSLIIGGEQEFPLATIAGWEAVKNWTEGLDPDKYPELFHLAFHSFSQNLDALESELKRVIDSEPPQGPTYKTVRGLLESVKQRESGAESAFVSDGMTDKGGGGGEQWQSSANIVESIAQSLSSALGEAIGLRIGEVIARRDEALLEGLRAAFDEQKQERARFVEAIHAESNRPIVIEVAPALVNIPEQAAQPAPVVNVTVTPEIRATLEQQPRSITLKKSGDTITGKSE